MELDIKFIQRILDINNRLNPVFWYWYYDLYSVCQNYLNNKILNFNHHISLYLKLLIKNTITVCFLSGFKFHLSKPKRSKYHAWFTHFLFVSVRTVSLLECPKVYIAKWLNFMHIDIQRREIYWIAIATSLL